MVHLQIQRLKSANRVLAEANKTRFMNGLHYHRVPFPVRLRSIHDSGRAKKKNCYPYEGKIVMLMHDSFKANTPGVYFKKRSIPSS
eukprot:8335091-Pyramimonas_sp.AAC.1